MPEDKAYHYTYSATHVRAQNNDLSQVIFPPISAYDRAKSNLVGQIYCAFPMGKPMIVCNNVPILNE